MLPMTDSPGPLLRVAMGLLLLIIPAACESTPRNLVVLLPEPNGKVGQVTVNTAGGSTILKTAGAATRIESANAGPSEIFQIKDERVQSIFNSAIKAQPIPPMSFTLYFYTDSVRMKAASLAIWPGILSEIRRRKAPDVGLIGHTDRAGLDAYNEPLSRRRADMIRRRLVKEGVGSHVIDISWHGEKNPNVKTPDGVSEPRNRRVDVIVR